MVPDPKQTYRSQWVIAFTLIMLGLFGALEIEAVLQHDTVSQVLSGLGIAGCIIQIWLRSRP